MCEAGDSGLCNGTGFSRDQYYLMVDKGEWLPSFVTLNVDLSKIFDTKCNIDVVLIICNFLYFLIE